MRPGALEDAQIEKALGLGELADEVIGDWNRSALGLLGDMPGEDFCDKITQGFGSEWLLQKVDGAELHGADGVRDVAVSGDDDRRGIQTALAHLGQQVEAI